MADIAAVFHWEPPVMEAMSVTNLAIWREHARQRCGSDE